MNPVTSWSLGPHEKRGLCLSSLGVCGGCGKRPPGGAKPKRCARCKGEGYCNAACQRAAWENGGHKTACKVLCGVSVGETPLSEVLEAREISAASEEAISLAANTSDEYDAQSDELFAKVQSTDEEEAHALLRKAAEDGHKGAQYAIALAYIDGGFYAAKENNGRADEEHILKWLKMAAENGHAEAQKTYGASYWYEGRNGHPVDMLKAVIWVRKALAHGVSENEGPDPKGNALSRRSFEGSVEDAVEMGRKLYLESFPSYLDGDQEAMECIKVAADCGIFPAIQAQHG